LFCFQPRCTQHFLRSSLQQFCIPRTRVISSTCLLETAGHLRMPAERVLLDFSAVNYIDVSACDELISFIKELKSRDITVAFARVRDPVRQNMQLRQIESVTSPADFHERITDGVTAWQRRGSDKPT